MALTAFLLAIIVLSESISIQYSLTGYYLAIIGNFTIFRWFFDCYRCWWQLRYMFICWEHWPDTAPGKYSCAKVALSNRVLKIVLRKGNRRRDRQVEKLAWVGPRSGSKLPQPRTLFSAAWRYKHGMKNKVIRSHICRHSRMRLAGIQLLEPWFRLRAYRNDVRLKIPDKIIRGQALPGMT